MLWINGDDEHILFDNHSHCCVQVENNHERFDVDERARVGPAYLKFWHQGVRRLFDACCLMYETTPEEMCEQIRPLLIQKGISVDDMELISQVLLRQADLELEAGIRMAKRYEGQTPLIDALQQLLEADRDG